MAWSSKEQPSALDTFTIPGLLYLHGQTIDLKYHQDSYNGKSYPLIEFPSGLTREVYDNPISHRPFINIWGGLNLPYFATRNEAYQLASQFAEMYQLQVISSQDNVLTILNSEGNRAYHVEFDNDHRHIKDMVLRPSYAMELLDGETRAVLPPLYANEQLGLKAMAPAKFFTPDTNWTWYPTEYDGTDIFFGLVSGYDLEMGYFTLSELEALRGPLGLPIERDRYYEPTDLETIQTWHRS